MGGWSLDAEAFARLCNALNAPEKLRIVDLIFFHGSQSITDVQKKLNLNFSTAHKYLNEMEMAGILSSHEQVEGGKRKKMYQVKPISLNVNPEFLSSLVRKRPMPDQPAEGSFRDFWFIDWGGNLSKLNAGEVQEALVKQRASVQWAQSLAKELNDLAYSGILVTQLHSWIQQRLESEEQQVHSASKAFESIPAFAKERNLLTLLEESGKQELVQSNLDGDYHIRKLSPYMLINVQHPLQLLSKHGLQLLGLESRASKHWSAFIGHVTIALSATNKHLASPHHGLDFFNVIAAPYMSELGKREVDQAAEETLHSLNQLYSIHGIETVLSIELEVPPFLKKEPVPGGFGKTYGDFESESIDFANALLNRFDKEKLEPFPKLCVKVRDEKRLPELGDSIVKRLYFANLQPDWQTANANYNRDWSRFDASWHGWEKTIGVANAQHVTINLPRAALDSKNESKSMDWIEQKIGQVKAVFLHSMEYVYAKQFTELQFLSKNVEGDNYCSLRHNQCNIGLLGFYPFMQSLDESDEVDLNHAKKLLQWMEKKAQFQDATLRVALNENKYYPIQQFFTISNNQKFHASHETYLGGIQCDPTPDKMIQYSQPQKTNEEKIEYYGALQQYLKAGHMAPLRSLDVETLHRALKSDMGLFCDETTLTWP